ncbi:drug/metabolite transporter superfamily protein YnfA [Catalinimonas alkaloidigena]|nr:drug/metabolite transporter superfamily protein YnfA [Catalinimonas alkaloidigena]
MAILWGWKVDGIIPDRYDIIGGIIALLGMLIIMYAPRAH